MTNKRINISNKTCKEFDSEQNDINIVNKSN